MNPTGEEMLAEFYETMRGHVGRRATHARGIVDERMIGRYAVAIGATDPVHFDNVAARAAGYHGIVAPPNLLAAVYDWGAGVPEGELNPDGTVAESARGSAQGSLRAMGAGEEMSLLAPVVAGVELVEEDELVDVVMKEGRSGPSVFVTESHTFRSIDGEVVNVNRRTVVIRGPHESAS